MSTYATSYNRQRGGMVRTRMYGNQNGLPGLPQTRYMPLGGHPRRPPPPLRMPGPPPPAAPMMSNHPPQPPAPQQSLPPPLSMPQPDAAAARRIDMLEQRLNATENSNRTLLDELMRLQLDLKMGVKKNEVGIAEQKEAINRLDTTVRQSQNRTYEIEDRIRRCEDGIKDVKNSVHMMSSHTKSIEKAISAFQQEQMERRSNSANRLQEYRHEVMKMNQSKEQLERLCFSLRDEMREVNAKVDNLSQEMGTLETNVKLQARLMEDNNNRRNLTPPKSTPKLENNSQMSETVRMALEGKIIQMNTLIQDLTHRLNQEAKKREKVETDVNIRLNELLEDYGSCKVEKDKEMRDFDEKMKELQAGFSASEKQRIHMEISSVAQDLSRKIDEKEAKLRADTVHKLTVIEKTLQEEKRRMTAKEKELETKVETQVRDTKMYGDDGADSLKKHVDQNINQVRDRLMEVTNNVNALQKEMGDHKLEQEKVILAEIEERKRGHKELDAKIDDLEDRHRVGMAKLQAAIGEQKNVTPSATPQKEAPDYDEGNEKQAEIERMQAENAEGIRQQVAKDIGRLEGRLGEVETKVKQQDERLDNRLKSAKAEDQEANSIMGDKIQQNIDAVAFSQEKLKKQVNTLQGQVQNTPKEVTNLKEQMEEMDNKIHKKIDQERKERMDDVEELRKDVDKIIGKNEPNSASVPSLARLNQDVDETQTGMKKLGAAIHVVKERLDAKLKDERKERREQDSTLTRDLDRLKTKYTELSDRIKKKSTSTTS